MKKLIPSDFMNQKKLVSHISFFLFSLIVAIVAGSTEKYHDSENNTLHIFIMVFYQIEVFIYIGSLLFANLNFDRSPRELTWIISTRFIVFMLACLLSAMILFILYQYTILILAGRDVSDVLYNFIHVGFADWLKSTLKGLSGGAIIFIVILWQTSLRREQKLKEENLVFQNETLKNQVNPHFLFNSLNTISSLVHSQPEIAEKFINNLSSVYRYILENSQKDTVNLKSELDFIRGYYNLHMIRDEEKIILNIDVPDEEKFEIIPVSLQILFENAIKHNLATRQNQLTISMYIEGQYIVVKNNLQKKATQLNSMKIGLKNLAERIRLTTGKALIIEETNSFYIVKIPLVL